MPGSSTCALPRPPPRRSPRGPYATLFRSHIGWSPRQRAEYLQCVVANQRFCVLPAGRVPNLASAVLGRVLRDREHTSELQSPYDLVCRLLLEKKKPLTLEAAVVHGLAAAV